MKQVRLMTLFAVLLTIVTGTNSCRKCYTCRNICAVCTKTGDPDQTVCKNNYTFSTDFDQAITELQDSGYSCQTGTGNLSEELCAGPAISEALRLEKEERGYSCTIK